jgi:hypothetical protein
MKLLLFLVMSLSVQVTKKMEESIFVDEELQGFDGDEDDPLCSSTSSPEPVSASILESETPQATTSSTVIVEAS